MCFAQGHNTVTPVGIEPKPLDSESDALPLQKNVDNKNAAEVDIAPASGKITKNIKYRSRAPGQGCFERVCHGHLLCNVTHSQLSQVQRKQL